MKKITVFLFVFLSLQVFAQELPTEAAPGFSFPIGSKFIIKPIQIDSVNFDFSVIAFEPFQEILNTYEHDSLFAEKEKDGTIEFYFSFSTHGDTEAEKEENMKILLIFKNRTEFNFSYESDIARTEDGEFESTSNVGSYSGVITSEMWPYMIYEIGLHDFKLNK